MKALTFLLTLILIGMAQGEKRAGADWWSFQPVNRPEVPRAGDGEWAANAIDRYVQRKLREHHLSPSPKASLRELNRRLSVDLLGLQPEWSYDESGLNGYERTLDRYLASPHYGEHWARHWLDIARFGESEGFERDHLRTNLWRYRDWVVEALNVDMPYDVFVRLQIAGDVLLSGSDQGIVATGFLVAGAYDQVGQSQQSAAMRAIVREEEMEDYVGTVGQAFLGLTVHCARCHDHKFDPISQKEYFQLAAALSGVRPGKRALAKKESSSVMARSLDHQIALLERDHEKHGQEIAHLKNQRKRWQDRQVYTIKPGPAKVVQVLNRGNPTEPGKVVVPAGVEAIRGVSADFQLPKDAPDAARRVRLAKWITHQANPLFARVIVNRLWHYHFGRGLIANPSDFGLHGGEPSHPHLLDWLASAIRERGWSLKNIHRLILTSATYQQASAWRAEAKEIDADNRFLWRHPPQRLDAEPLRDAMLQISGQWNRTMGGPGYYDFTTYIHNTQFYEMIDPAGHTYHRRSLYRTWVRSGRNAFLDVFDCPDPSVATPKRAVTTTPLQALSLLNNSFVLRMAQHFADRVETEAQGNLSEKVSHALMLVYGRKVETKELEEAVAFVEQHGLAALCRVLFNSNEFLHVD